MNVPLAAVSGQASEVLDLFLELARPTPPGRERRRPTSSRATSATSRSTSRRTARRRSSAATPATCSRGSRRHPTRGVPLLPVRAPRHGAAGGRDRAGRRGRHRAERGRDDPRRRQQGHGRGDARRRRHDPPREPAARRRRALFTPKEEVGLLGASAFDHPASRRSRVRLRPGGAGRADRARGADERSLHVRFHGRAAHAGMVPEEGRSAIAAAARRSRSSGSGGSTTRRRPTSARSRRHGPQHRPRVVLVRGRGPVARRAEAPRPRPGDARPDHVRRPGHRLRGRDADRGDLPRLPLQRDDPPVRLAADALRTAGVEPTYALTGGGADANVFTARGSPASTSRTGWPRSTRRTSTSRSPISSGWSTSRSRSSRSGDAALA